MAVSEMNYSEYCIENGTTIRDAMKRLDVVHPKILFVVKNNRLNGALTDGDIRRYLFRGGKVEDCVINAANPNPRYAYDEAQAKELYDTVNYVAIPIVTDSLEIRKIFIGVTIKPAIRLSVPVVINAGGRGARLDPFTRVLPKPLIPVGDLPIIEHIMRQFEQYGCDVFHMIVNYKRQLIKAYFRENERHYNLSWHDEDKPLGTGGGLCLLKGSISETFFFTNCDILLQSDYDSMLRFHKQNHNAITMVCACKNMPIPYGVIEMGSNGSIEHMKEKPEFSFLTNTGMYIVEPEVLNDIVDDSPITFPEIIEMEKRKGRNVAAYPVSENEWMDMGQLSELEKMRVRLYGE